MDKKWHDLETLLRRGERAAVLRGMKATTRQPLNPLDRLQAARLYRKAGLPSRTLQILGPWEEQSTDMEKAEYGAALVNLGAAREGMRILNSLSGAPDSRIVMIRAAQRIREWDWSAAAELLEHLPQSRMYLATCLIHGAHDYDRASQLLEETLRRPAAPTVTATAWLLLAQSHSLAGNLAAGRSALRRCREALPAGATSHPTLLGWMIRQWELLLLLRQAGARDRSALKELLGEVRGGFRALGGWEWARSCSLFSAEILGDTSELQRLYWTTPYPAFRARVRAALAGCPDFREDRPYLLRQGPRGAPVLEVARGHFAFSRNSRPTQAQLKPLQAGHRLLIALCSDFHQPHRIAELHERIFPEDGFRPETSSDRVHKIIGRLRLWLAAHRTGLLIPASSGGFELRPGSGCHLLLPPGDPLPSRKPRLAGPALQDWIARARLAFDGATFTAGQAWGRLGGSRRTLARRLRDAREAGLVLSEGFGPATTYRAVSEASPARAPGPAVRR